MIFSITVNYVLYWLNSSLCKCSFCFTRCRENFKVFFFAKLFEKSSIFCFFINPKLLKSVFSRNHFFESLSSVFGIISFPCFELWQVAEKHQQQLKIIWLHCFDSLVCPQMPSLMQSFENVWLEDQILYMISWFAEIVLPSLMTSCLLHSSFAQNRTQLYP